MPSLKALQRFTSHHMCATEGALAVQLGHAYAGVLHDDSLIGLALHSTATQQAGARCPRLHSQACESHDGAGKDTSHVVEQHATMAA